MLLDIVFFTVMPTFGGPIALLILELLILIPMAKRMEEPNTPVLPSWQRRKPAYNLAGRRTYPVFRLGPAVKAQATPAPGRRAAESGYAFNGSMRMCRASPWQRRPEPS